MTRNTTEAELAAIMADVQTDVSEPRRLRLFSVDDLRQLPPPSWLVEPFIPDRGVSVLFGASGSLKSFLALDWTLSIAAGTEWLGHPTATGPTVYLALEGGHGLLKRIEAWQQLHPDVDVSDFRAVIDIVSLLEEGDVQLLAEAVKEEIAEPPRVIVIDTVARAMPAGDENSARDVGLLIAASDLLARTFECSVLLVHHSGHGETGRERGSSALPGAAEARLRLSRSGDRLTLTTLKQKDHSEADPLNLTYREVGESLVIEAGEQGSWRPTDAMSQVLRVLGDASGPLSQRQLEEAVSFKGTTVRAACVQLADEKRIDRYAGPNNSWLHRLRDEPDRVPLTLIEGDET